MGKAQKIKEQRRQERVEKKARKKRFWKNVLIYSVVILTSSGLALGATYMYQKFTKENPKPDTYKTGERKYSEYPEMIIDTDKQYFATLETDFGKMKIELSDNSAPKTVNNFVSLSRDNFYNGLTFHRVIKDFMIQGGDPDGTGSGGPGYKFEDEALESAQYNKGTLAMANSGENTNGSQFFIMTKDNPDLPKSYTVFGKVTEGLDVLDKIAAVPVKDNGSGEASTPITPPKINKITIEEK